MFCGRNLDQVAGVADPDELFVVWQRGMQKVEGWVVVEETVVEVVVVGPVVCLGTGPMCHLAVAAEAVVVALVVLKEEEDYDDEEPACPQ